MTFDYKNPDISNLCLDSPHSVKLSINSKRESVTSTTPTINCNSPPIKKVKNGNLRIGKDGLVTFKKTPSNVLMPAIQLGISHSLAKMNPKPKQDLLLRDFFTVDNISFPPHGSDSTPAHRYKDFRFKSYSQAAFRHLRDHFEIAPEDFLSSVCYKPLKSINNPGASGSLFYLTEDDKFIIKTVSSKEATFLQKMLAGYWMNLHQNHKTLLPKFFGLYCYQSGKQNIRFIIMNNLLPTSIHYDYRFDLKGSTYGRQASQKEHLKESPTLKDLDFVREFREGLTLAPDIYNTLVDTLMRDCMVLESFDIMDYSLLVAIHNVSDFIRKQNAKQTNLRQQHRLQPVPLPRRRQRLQSIPFEPVENNHDDADDQDNDESNEEYSYRLKPQGSLSSGYSIISLSNSEHDSLISRSYDVTSYIAAMPEGGILARLKNGDLAIVYIGVIDILQNYRTKKKIEHAMKSIVTNGNSISVTRPNFYSRRFNLFISRIVFRSEVQICAPARGRRAMLRKNASLSNIIDRLITIQGFSESNLRWTPPPDYVKTHSASVIVKSNTEDNFSEDDSVFGDDTDNSKMDSTNVNRANQRQQAIKYFVDHLHHTVQTTDL